MRTEEGCQSALDYRRDIRRYPAQWHASLDRVFIMHHRLHVSGRHIKHEDSSLGHYSLSKPWVVNFSVRLFSVTVRTTLSGVPFGISASNSRVTVTVEPIRP